MKEYAPTQIRNLVLLGHGGAGKTSLVEALLFRSGATKRLGRVDDGTTVTDFDEEEVRRHISISTALAPCEWKDHKLNFLDAPGYLDFVGEVKEAIRVADGAIVVVDAVSGVEVGTELVWKYADERQLPRIVVINKMDRENASYERALASLRESFDGVRFVPIQLPIGSQSEFKGVVDLIGLQAILGSGGETGEIPADLSDAVEEARFELIEVAAEGDDTLLEKYLEGGELSDEELWRGLRAGVIAGEVVPVLCAAALPDIAVQPILQAAVALFPSPAEVEAEATNPATGETVTLQADASGPLAALVFKTTADPYVGKISFFRVYSGAMVSDSRVFNPRTGEEERIGQLFVMRGKEQIAVSRITAGDIGAVTKLAKTLTADTLCDRDQPLVLPGIEFPKPIYSLAVAPKTKADSAKMGPSLTRLVEEDPTLEWHHEPSTRQAILSGMGETHLDVAVRRLATKFGVEVETSTPKVPYRETITRTATAQYRHKKQTGGAGQFAEVHIRVEPLPRGAGFEYVWEVFGGAISSSFMPSIEKGIRQVMEQGVIAGYPVEDVKVAVYDGKEHPVDSKDIAFQIAGREVFKLAVQNAGPVLLEPIMNLQVIVPEEYMGDVLGDLNTKRARVQGMDQQGNKSIITAQVPLAEMQRYATELRSITQGRGFYSMEFSHYEEVPAHIAQEIIEAAKRERENSSS